jgi:hypothetical protein
MGKHERPSPNEFPNTVTADLWATVIGSVAGYSPALADNLAEIEAQAKNN